jgi:hypothetical protein
MRARIALLLLWLAGILFPLAWLGRFSHAYRRLFDIIFSPEWMHWVMHALLYAGLVVLLGLVIPLPPGRRGLLLVLGLMLATGALQEYFQAISQGFGSITTALFDLGVDLAGGMMGLAGMMVHKYRSYRYDV